MLVDANILLYAVDEASPFHEKARDWLTGALNGTRRVGIPWQSLWAFLRIATNPRALSQPVTPEQAWGYVEDWLDAPTTWLPSPGPNHRDILRELLIEKDLRAGLVSDAVLAALCIEYGLSIVSADSDFGRFPEVAHINPLQ